MSRQSGTPSTVTMPLFVSDALNRWVEAAYSSHGAAAAGQGPQISLIRHDAVVDLGLPALVAPSLIAADLADWFDADAVAVFEEHVSSSGIRQALVQFGRSTDLTAHAAISPPYLAFVELDSQMAWESVSPQSYGSAVVSLDDAFATEIADATERLSQDNQMFEQLAQRGFVVRPSYLSAPVSAGTAYEQSTQATSSVDLDRARAALNEQRYEDAVVHFELALTHAQLEDRDLDSAEILLAIGELYAVALDRPRDAVATLLDATDQLETLAGIDGDDDLVITNVRAAQGLAHGRRVMALAISELGEATLAASTYQLAEEVFRALGQLSDAGLMAFEAGVVLAGAGLEPVNDWTAATEAFELAEDHLCTACVLAVEGGYLVEVGDIDGADARLHAAVDALRALKADDLALSAEAMRIVIGIQADDPRALENARHLEAAFRSMGLYQQADDLVEILNSDDAIERQEISDAGFLLRFVSAIREGEPINLSEIDLRDDV